MSMAGSVCFVVGARPNFMKVAPVISALAARSPETEVVLVRREIPLWDGRAGARAADAQIELVGIRAGAS